MWFLIGLGAFVVAVVYGIHRWVDREERAISAIQLENARRHEANGDD